MLEAQTPNALESLESFSMKMKDSSLNKELMDPTAPVWEPVRVSSGTWHESANKLLQSTPSKEDEDEVVDDRAAAADMEAASPDASATAVAVAAFPGAAAAITAADAVGLEDTTAPPLGTKGSTSHWM